MLLLLIQNSHEFSATLDLLFSQFELTRATYYACAFLVSKICWTMIYFSMIYAQGGHWEKNMLKEKVKHVP